MSPPCPYVLLPPAPPPPPLRHGAQFAEGESVHGLRPSAPTDARVASFDAQYRGFRFESTLQPLRTPV